MSDRDDRDDLADLHSDRIATTEARPEGFYWAAGSIRAEIYGNGPIEVALTAKLGVIAADQTGRWVRAS
jgi:hypothetical protein